MSSCSAHVCLQVPGACLHFRRMPLLRKPLLRKPLALLRKRYCGLVRTLHFPFLRGLGGNRCIRYQSPSFNCTSHAACSAFQSTFRQPADQRTLTGRYPSRCLDPDGTTFVWLMHETILVSQTAAAAPSPLGCGRVGSYDRPPPPV